MAMEMPTALQAEPSPSPTEWLWGPVSIWFRRGRMREFERAFELTGDTRIIDVGGTEPNWHFIGAKPHVLLVNITGEVFTRGKIVAELGDGTDLRYPDGSFDIAYSNSVVEHLYTFDKQRAFAREIARLAPNYYVQTPNKWFPVEPHILCPFIHWLPVPIYRRLVRWLSLWGWMARPNQAEIDAKLDEIKLLTEGQLRALFPDGELVRERFLGMTKSLIVMRRRG